MKNATKYLVVGSLGVLMTRRDISSLAVKGLKGHISGGKGWPHKRGSTVYEKTAIKDNRSIIKASY